MTVGIAALCDDTSDPKVVLTADRLVTTGHINRIEFEHPNSKVVKLYESDDVSAMGIAAGSLSLADDFFDKLSSRCDDNGPEYMSDIHGHATSSYHALQRETFNNQTLAPLDMSLVDLSDPNKSIGREMQRGLLNEIGEKKQEISNNLQVLIAGVDSKGPHVCEVSDGDVASYNSVGYHMVGSGSRSAQSVFIRNQYSPDCEINDAIFRVAEAKMQAKEAQGVGTNMDLIVIHQNEFNRIEDDTLRSVRSIQEDIERRQRNVRSTVISEGEFEYNTD